LILNEVSSLLGHTIISMTSVSGGDINRSFRLITETREEYFLKYNDVPQAYSMFISEEDGLRKLSEVTNHSVPKVLLTSKLSKGACLIMQFESRIDWQKESYIRLGEMLAKVHGASSDNFGFYEDNYLATLHQQNAWKRDFVSFYLLQRIEPLLKKAIDKDFLDARYSLWAHKAENSLRSIIPTEAPALLHGDLWSGNVMNTSQGPLFLDPAVYYGHREIDIAMSKMFGGFQNGFYDAYLYEFPLAPGWEARLPIFQLYPYLVHLVLFGKSYSGSTKRILDRYF
jgi:fructosamine-3-kinase